MTPGLLLAQFLGDVYLPQSRLGSGNHDEVWRLSTMSPLPACCPHCSADIMTLGKSDVCWHCRQPLGSETSDSSGNHPRSLNDFSPDQSAPASAKETAESPNAVWQGIGWAILLPVLLLLVVWDSTFVGYSFGLFQWIWIVPMMRKARSEGRPMFARGLKIGAWLVFAPYAAVFGLIGGIWILMHIDLTPGSPWFY